jgi:ligand-binding sensor domain-containing protein
MKIEYLKSAIGIALVILIQLGTMPLFGQQHLNVEHFIVSQGNAQSIIIRISEDADRTNDSIITGVKSSNIFSDKLKDNEGNVWICTEAGVGKINPERNLYSVLECDHRLTFVLETLCEFSKGNLQVKSKQKGWLAINQKSNAVKAGLLSTDSSKDI